MAELTTESLEVFTTTTPPLRVAKRYFEATTDIGLRSAQEDRFVLVPSFFREDAAFCGVFDGTVGDHASDFIGKNIINIFCSTEEVRNPDSGIFSVSPRSPESIDASAEKVRSALHKTFLDSDEALINYCHERKLHYASSTGVAVFLWQNLLTVAHVGDSRACIAREVGGNIFPEWLTVDHKPNMPHELKRIEACGGSLAYLHGNKPYIRGGDFLVRQAAGEHPKQLNYSRAFGGKDLKRYGLSAVPDISHFALSSDDKLVLLGSDGLWDVVNPRTACEIAFRCRREGRSATEALVSYAIEHMPSTGVRDNVTVIAIFLNEV